MTLQALIVKQEAKLQAPTKKCAVIGFGNVGAGEPVPQTGSPNLDAVFLQLQTRGLRDRLPSGAITKNPTPVYVDVSPRHLQL